MIRSYPSIYSIGHKVLREAFDANPPVWVQEKVDGSQFSFVKTDDGVVHFRSKGAVIYPESPPKLFKAAVNSVLEIAGELPCGLVFRGEAVTSPRHNTLKYSRVPLRYVAIFDIEKLGYSEEFLDPKELHEIASSLGFETVPLLDGGLAKDYTEERFRALLESESFLGGQKVEGVVLKLYGCYGPDKKTLMAKFVSEEFKETHKKSWSVDNPAPKDILTTIGGQYANPARWGKAVQRLRESDSLTDSPKDIGPLIAEIKADLLKEDVDSIKEELWKWAQPQIMRSAIHRFPEWYKEQLMKSQFSNEVSESE